MFKSITIWSRLIKNKWEHNHINDGYCEKAIPTPVSLLQKQSWAKAIWKKKFGYLNNGIVEEHINA